MNSIESIYVRAIKTRCISNEQTFDVFNKKKMQRKNLMNTGLRKIKFIQENDSKSKKNHIIQIQYYRFSHLTSK